MPTGSKRLGWIQKAWDLEPERRSKVVAATAIVRAERILSRMTSDLLAEFDLTPSRYEVLVALHFSESGTESLGSLAKGLAIHPPTLTYTVNQLVSQRLIARRIDGSDRRVVTAKITASGRALVVRANDKLASVHFGLTELTKAEAECVGRALAKLTYG